MNNFIATIFKKALNEGCAQNIALQDKEESFTYDKLANIVYAATQFLSYKGIKKQDIIINALGNSAQQIVLHYATILLGAISVPISNDLKQDRAIYFSSELKAKILFTDKDLDKVINLEIIKISKYNELAHILSPFSQKFIARKEFNINPQELVAIMFTTGSTGKPKGVKLTHACVNQALNNIKNYIGYTQNNKEVIPLPIYHNFGLGHVYCTHSGGGTVYITDGIKSLKKFFAAFNKNYNATALTPSMLKILLNERFRNKTISTLRKLDYIVINTEKLPEEITKDLITNCPGLRIMFYYGLTEASRSFFITLSDQKKEYYKSVGKPTSQDVKVKIIDGEICIGGNHLFAGYWNEKANNIENDYFKTGDLGYIDKAGYLFINGRKKDLINIGGLKISSEEIKAALLKVKGIIDTAVISLEDKILGEAPMALIVRQENVSENFIINELRKYLENFAIPKKIMFANFIPRSETGKTLTSEVKKIIQGI